jgi:antirestriction protein ArdC
MIMAARMDKDEYKAMKQGEQKALQHKLDSFLKSAIETKDGMADLVAHYRISGLYGYSFYNSLMIKLQGGHIAQSFNGWKKLDRCVMTGQKSHISVFMPMFKKEEVNGKDESKLIGFKLVPVFDLSQTDGKPLQYDHNSTETLDIPYAKVAKVMTELTGAPVVEELTGDARGYSDGQRLVVSSMSNDTDKAKTLIHEASHHLNHTSKAASKVEVSSATKEVEAEATAYLVMAYMGLDFELSKTYVNNWKDGIADARADLIIRTADKMIKGLKKELTEEEQFLMAV